MLSWSRLERCYSQTRVHVGSVWTFVMPSFKLITYAICQPLPSFWSNNAPRLTALASVFSSVGLPWTSLALVYLEEHLFIFWRLHWWFHKNLFLSDAAISLTNHFSHCGLTFLSNCSDTPKPYGFKLRLKTIRLRPNSTLGKKNLLFRHLHGKVTFLQYLLAVCRVRPLLESNIEKLYFRQFAFQSFLEFAGSVSKLPILY